MYTNKTKTAKKHEYSTWKICFFVCRALSSDHLGIAECTQSCRVNWLLEPVKNEKTQKMMLKTRPFIAQVRLLKAHACNGRTEKNSNWRTISFSLSHSLRSMLHSAFDNYEKPKINILKCNSFAKAVRKPRLKSLFYTLGPKGFTFYVRTPMGTINDCSGLLKGRLNLHDLSKQVDKRRHMRAKGKYRGTHACSRLDNNKM